MGKPPGVMLMALGGPGSLEEVSPFMESLLGRAVPPQLVQAVSERYRLIGGKSPLPDLVRAQAEGLNKELEGLAVPLVGFRHCRPYIGETLFRFIKMGISRVIALPMTPFYSTVTTGSYKKALLDDYSDDPRDIEIVFVESWHDHPSFIRAWVEKVKQDLEQFPVDEQARIQVIFSAHNIPVRYIKNGDPYQRQVEDTVKRLVKCLDLKFWWLAYQSKGMHSSEPWLEPEIEKIISEIAAAGCKDLLLVPIGFTCDHLETLYDMDILYKKYAEHKGLNLRRTESLNTSHVFIKALADIVREYLS